MAPWAGRIGRGKLDTPHGIEELSTKLLPPHAIHGLLFDAQIQIGEVGESSAMVWCDLPAPYSGARVEQSVVVGESTMTWSIAYQNGGRSMPVWLGFHPWFRRTLSRGSEVEVVNPASFMMVLDGEAIPNGKIQGVTPPPWDDVFGGMRSAPTLTWPGALKITCVANEPWWVIYTMDPVGVCIEPQTAPPHAAALGLAPILAPGERIRLDYQLNFESA
ncbi:aldose 1-epimerase [mine drainage metagenome]|uniref:Aldose 1-epimerase n=1 Tax=mine drainage metagenome TaxID=410659 RepID=A0A1J5QTP1_9ZZZZ